MNHDGQHGVRAHRTTILLGSNDAFEHAVDGLKVRGVGREVHRNLLAGGARERALGTEVVLHVTGALHGAGILCAFELPEDLPVGLAGDVGEHAESTTVGHADGDLFEILLGGLLDDGIQQGDCRFATFEAESLLADVLGLQEGLECLGLVELAEDAHLVIVVGLGVWLLDVLLNPTALFRILDVHVFDAHGAAVSVAEHPEDVTQQRGTPATEATGDEFAIQVPEGESMARDVEVGVRTLAVLEWIGVSHQVAAHAERVDELLHAGDLADAVCGVDIDVGGPMDRVVRNAQCREDVFVEQALADEALVDLLKELARAGTLDNAVVVCARQCDGLTDGQLGERLRACPLKLGGVFEGSCAHNSSGAAHEAGHGMLGADAAGVRQRDGVAGIVGARELIGTTTTHDVFIGDEELAEAHRICALDSGHDERAGAIRLRDVDGDTEVDVGRGDH